MREMTRSEKHGPRDESDWSQVREARVSERMSEWNLPKVPAGPVTIGHADPKALRAQRVTDWVTKIDNAHFKESVYREVPKDILTEVGAAYLASVLPS